MATRRYHNHFLRHWYTLCLFLVSNMANGIGAEECDCNPLVEYCDKFASACRSCEELCQTKRFSECEEKCELYLKDIIFQRTAVTHDDLHLLQYLLAVVTAITFLTLLLIVVLVIMKLQRRKRKRHEVIPMHHFPPPAPTRTSTPNPAAVATAPVPRQQTPITVPPPSRSPSESASTTPPPRGFRHDSSLPTMTTQLSQDTTLTGTTNGRSMFGGGGNGRGGSNYSSVGRSNYRSPRRRMPSEDCVPEHSEVLGKGNDGYDNPALELSRGSASGSTSPTGGTHHSTLPQQQKFKPNGNGGPYTISHSQVV